MAELKILAEVSDEYGLIRVTDDGLCRRLSFAAGDEQSCCLLAAPHVLQYEYTQAMLLVMLFCRPKRVLLLGLGAGSLVTTLHHYFTSLKLSAVELRPLVIELAQRYFYLPRSKRLTVLTQDALQFLRAGAERKVDVIFADLYHSNGIDAVQLQADFIALCAQNLKPNGWLVLNAWTEHRDDVDFVHALRVHFQDIHSLVTSSGNWVILAGKELDMQSSNALKQEAFRLSSLLGFPLTRHLARLYTWAGRDPSGFD